LKGPSSLNHLLARKAGSQANSENWLLAFCLVVETSRSENRWSGSGRQNGSRLTKTRTPPCRIRVFFGMTRAVGDLSQLGFFFGMAYEQQNIITATATTATVTTPATHCFTQLVIRYLCALILRQITGMPHGTLLITGMPHGTLLITRMPHDYLKLFRISTLIPCWHFPCSLRP
jgi:hypothetical protein